jgi:hypothetical protein
MLRTALLALALALGGGAPYLGSFVHLVSAIWTAQADAGGHTDPNGGTAAGDAGSHYDPNG